MPFLNELKEEDLEILQEYMEDIQFPKDSLIMREGDPGDGCYIIDEGIIRLEIQNEETDSEGVIGYLEPGMLLGEFSLLDGKPRSASAYAQTDVVTRWFSNLSYQDICVRHPQLGISISNALGGELTEKLRRVNQRIAGYIFADEIDSATNEMVERAKVAQQAFQGWSEERVDALLKDVAEAIANHAEELAEATVSETEMGIVADKISKIRVASLDVCETLLGHRAAGLLKEDSQRQITEFASPVGIILGLIPVTNPIPTIIFKTLISIKSRNALILSCHRSALGAGNRSVDIIREVLDRHEAPANLIQSIRERTSRQKTMMFMQHPDVSFVLATGGASMVKAAYSSGTPCIGVGPGNAPVLVCADADLSAAAEKIIGSKSFDNGVICGSENNIVVVSSVRQAFSEMLEKHGAAILTPDEKNRLTPKLFDPETKTVQRSIVGKSAQFVAEAAGIHRDGNIRLLVVPVRLDEMRSPYGHEKMVPVLSLFTVRDEEEGIKVAKQILAGQGRGHTAVIHSQNQELIEQYGQEMEASRILVNTPASLGCIGIGNGLTPSFTLGCGTFSGNSTTDNVTYTHLMNVRRLALNMG